MNNKLLSICIPIYNMGRYLDINLQEIIKVIEKYSLTKEIEICISDNASIDDTEEIAKKYQEKNICNIIYHKNKENIGADRNFLKVIEIANGKYCWFMGADDIILEKALLNVLELIKENKYDIILGDRINIDLEGKIKNIQYWSKEKMIVNNLNFYNFIEKSYRIGAVFSYISSIVFKKDIWNKNLKKLDIDKFIGSAYIHSLVLISMIKNGSSMLYLHQPVVKNRVGNDSFLDKGYFNRVKIDFNYLDIFEYLFSINSKEYQQIQKLLNKERIFLHFLKAKYMIGYDKKQMEEFYLFLNKHNIKNKYIIKYTPNIVIWLLLKIYQKLKR